MVDHTKFPGIPLSVLYAKPTIIRRPRSALTKNLADDRFIKKAFAGCKYGLRGIPLSVPLNTPPDIAHPSACKIGQDTTDGNYIDIGIGERRSGLYILGKPRIGKSWLIVNMILQDIERGDGVFFLDPHGDAIDDLLKRTTSGVLVFDPKDEHYSFGINLLECANIDNVAARNDTFNKAKGVFDKLWKNTFEDKPWLQLILQNTIYAFIETRA